MYKENNKILYPFFKIFVFCIMYKTGLSRNCAIRGWEEFKVESLSGLSPFRVETQESLRGWVNLGLSPFWVESLRGWVNSGLSPSGGWVHLGLSPFGVGYIRGWVHSGLGPFGVGYIRGWIHSGLSLSRFNHSGFSRSRFSRWSFSNLTWSPTFSSWIVHDVLEHTRLFQLCVWPRDVK